MDGIRVGARGQATFCMERDKISSTHLNIQLQQRMSTTPGLSGRAVLKHLFFVISNSHTYLE
jgi:hypothetical protein